MVQVVAVLTSIAFVGVIFVVVGFIVFGGGDSTSSHGGVDLVAESQDRVDENPNDPDAWSQLAAAEFQDGDTEAALAAAQRAAELDPKDFGVTQTVVSFQLSSGNAPGAIQTLQGFTESNPENAEGFFTLGQIADQNGQTDLARLSYQKYLQLAPDGDFAVDVQDRLEGIANGEPPPAGAPPGQAGGGGGQGG